MTGDGSKKVDPAYPSGDGLSAAGEAAMGVLGGAAGLLVPVVGPAATQAILKRAIKLPLEQRRTNWFNSLGEGLRELQDRLEDFDPDTLGENEEFVSAVAEATQIAMRTHKAEKIEALKNTVLNTAANITFDDVIRGSFMQMIDIFSGLHYEILRQLQKSIVPVHQRMKPAGRNATVFEGTLDTTQTTMYFDLEQEYSNSIMSRVIYDLSVNQLVSFSAAKGARELEFKYTTYLGDDFLRFVSSPW